VSFVFEQEALRVLAEELIQFGRGHHSSGARLSIQDPVQNLELIDVDDAVVLQVGGGKDIFHVLNLLVLQ